MSYPAQDIGGILRIFYYFVPTKQLFRSLEIAISSHEITISFPQNTISRERISISRERDKKKTPMPSLGLRKIQFSLVYSILSRRRNFMHVSHDIIPGQSLRPAHF